MPRIKRSLEHTDLVPGAIIEHKETGQQLKIGHSASVFCGVGYARHYQVFDMNGRFLTSSWPASYIQQRYRKPLPGN